MLRLGRNQKKVLLLLGGAVALTCCYSSRQVSYLVKGLHRDWKRLDRQSVNRSLATLRKKKLVTFEKNGKYFTPVLTRIGKKEFELSRMDRLRIPRPPAWDGIWRVVMFDVTEDDRRVRDYFRRQLRRLNFYKLQKSVLVYPYPCRRQIEKISETYRDGAAIRFLEATYIDNEEMLRKHFNLG